MTRVHVAAEKSSRSAVSTNRAAIHFSIEVPDGDGTNEANLVASEVSAAQQANAWGNMTDSQQQIVPGISVSSSGQASVDPSLADVLFDLALQLEGSTDLPVDVEHVLAATVLAARNGELAPDKPLTSNDPALAGILETHVKLIFADYGGKVGRDD